MFHKKLTGVSSLFLATALYGGYGIFSRLIALEFDVFTQNWVRNFIVILLATVLLLFLGQRWKKIIKKDAPWIATWVLCDVIFVIALFVSFNNLPIGTALFLIFAGSTITAYVVGTLLLKEKLSKGKVLAIIVSLLGLLLIYGGQIQTTNPFFLILGLFAGVIAGLWYVLPKKISDDYPNLQLIVLSAGGIFFVNFILALVSHQNMPNPSFSIAWLGLILYAVAQIMGDLLLIKGSRLVEAHIGSLVLPFEALFGVLFAYIFFHETLPLTTILGGILIIIASIIPNLKKYY